MVSKSYHALMHLLYQIRFGWFDAQVAAIVSNHWDARDMAEASGIALHHWPVTRDNKNEQESRLIQLVQDKGRAGGAGARHAGSVKYVVEPALWADHQYPSSVPTRSQKRKTLSSGA